MFDIFGWLQPVKNLFIVSFVSGLLVVFLVSKKSPREGRLRQMPYSWFGKLFALFTAFTAIFFIKVALQTRDTGHIFLAFFLATFCTGVAVYRMYQSFCIRLSYDDDYIYYQSLLAGSRKAPWSNLRDVGYSKFLQTSFIVVEGIGTIWCPEVRKGHAELGQFLSKKTRKPVSHMW